MEHTPYLVVRYSSGYPQYWTGMGKRWTDKMEEAWVYTNRKNARAAIRKQRRALTGKPGHWVWMQAFAKETV